MGNEEMECKPSVHRKSLIKLKGLGRNRISTCSQEDKKKMMKAFMSAGTTRYSS